MSCAASEHLLQDVFFQDHLTEFDFAPNMMDGEGTQSLKYRCDTWLPDPKEGLSLALVQEEEKVANFFLFILL